MKLELSAPRIFPLQLPRHFINSRSFHYHYLYFLLLPLCLLPYSVCTVSTHFLQSSLFLAIRSISQLPSHFSLLYLLFCPHSLSSVCLSLVFLPFMPPLFVWVFFSHSFLPHVQTISSAFSAICSSLYKEQFVPSCANL